MQQLPKIVKERLATPALTEHPDADVLTAFAEQSLPGADRAFVMEHVARCGDCREVLALALPEMEEAQATATFRRPWFSMPGFSMPVLRWGAIAAAFVVVVSVGVLRYRQGTPQLTASVNAPKDSTFSTFSNVVNKPSLPATRAGNQAPSSAAAPAGAEKPSPIVAPSAPGDTAAQVNVNPMRARTNSDTLVASRAAAAGSAAARVAREPAADSNPFAASIRPAPPAPTQSETVNVAAASPTPSTEQSQLTSDQSQISGQTERESPEERTVGKAKAPVPQAMGSPALARNSTAGLEMTIASTISAPGPHWTITPAGGLQRSFDEGKTWQDISVIANSSAAKVAMQAEPSALSAQNVPQLKKQKDSTASPILRAISASGLEIWAGAAGGVLYHSSDAGGHWMSIIPSDHGTLLTGDVVSLQFGDISHGRVATSTSEIWITADAGQHWSKQ